MERLPLPEVRYLLRKSFCEETSLTPESWTTENLSIGHCVEVALLAQDYLGGAIQRVPIPTGLKARVGVYRLHYRNILENGSKFELIEAQFPEDFPYEDFLDGRVGTQTAGVYTRQYLLSLPGTAVRFAVLKQKFEDVLHSRKMYTDKKFQLCWDEAFSEGTVCPKMRFGCAVFEGDRLITKSSNKPMTQKFGKGRFCSPDGEQCIRLSLPSRVNANLGDCAHAPFWAIKNVFDMGYRPSDLAKLDFYEVGFFPQDFSPWERTELCYTCLQCQNDFAVLGLDKIWGVFEDRWVPMYTRDSFYSSSGFATGEKMP